jgi:murein DD-endopeptidase MepM/ murein hydrolase activator NlpD
MSIWPIEENRNSKIPDRDDSGSFWSRIGNFYNCGVDLFSEESNTVMSMYGGTIIHKGKFTSKEDKSYLKDSDYVVIKSSNNLHIKYAGISSDNLPIGTHVEAGQVIGKIQTILDDSHKTLHTTITDVNLINYFADPRLHIEVYKPPFVEIKPYSFGLFKAHYQPQAIINPTFLLESIEQKSILAV